MTRQEAHARLLAFVEKHGGQTGAAKALGISLTYMNDIYHQRRELSDHVLDKLGMTREETIKVKRSA